MSSEEITAYAMVRVATPPFMAVRFLGHDLMRARFRFAIGRERDGLYALVDRETVVRAMAPVGRMP